jgi:hypothetical protein
VAEGRSVYGVGAMGIDLVYFEQLERRGEHLLTLDDPEQRHLRPAFELFKSRTGRFIDPYGDTPFPVGTLEPLLTAVQDSYASGLSSGVAAQTYQRFVAVLATAIREGRGILFVGD